MKYTIVICGQPRKSQLTFHLIRRCQSRSHRNGDVQENRTTERKGNGDRNNSDIHQLHITIKQRGMLRSMICKRQASSSAYVCVCYVCAIANSFLLECCNEGSKRCMHVHIERNRLHRIYAHQLPVKVCVALCIPTLVHAAEVKAASFPPLPRAKH